MIRLLERISVRNIFRLRWKALPPLNQRLLAVYMGNAIRHPYKSIEPASRLRKVGQPFKNA